VIRVFSSLYDRVLVWARHPRAHWYLGALSFAESSFFPIPPDVMLAPMVLARREKAWYFATLTTITSVVGGIAGFAIGMVAIEWVQPALERLGYMDEFHHAQEWFVEYGFWAILAAGFSPIPYKIFTIAAGAMSMMIVPFVAASAVGRGARFFLVAALIFWGGERFEQNLRRYVDLMGWLLVGLCVIAYFVFRSQ
jgi:membrane protein YqaA with SNARE-associated domain